MDDDSGRDPIIAILKRDLIVETGEVRPYEIRLSPHREMTCQFVVHSTPCCKRKRMTTLESTECVVLAGKSCSHKKMAEGYKFLSDRNRHLWTEHQRVHASIACAGIEVTESCRLG